MVSIEIPFDTPGAIIRYTTDGSEPDENNENSSIYESPVPIALSMVIKAKAYKPGWSPSETVIIFKGDINEDGYVDLADVISALQVLVGLSKMSIPKPM